MDNRKIVSILLILNTLFLNSACAGSNRNLLESGGIRSDAPTGIIVEDTVGNAVNFIVTNTEDSGTGSLREAVEQAESGNTVTFDPLVFSPSSPATIFLTKPLFLGKGGIIIDASDAGVILDGSAGAETGILIQSSDNAIYGIKFMNFKEAGLIIDGDGDPSRSMHNLIGGNQSSGSGPYGQGNCFVANGDGISVQRGASENMVSASLFGLEADGSAHGNSMAGIIIQAEANRNVIGPNNAVAYNGQAGIVIHGGSVDNTITQTISFNNSKGNIFFSQGGNYEQEAQVEIESLDCAKGFINGKFNPGSGGHLEFYSGDSSGPRFYEGETGDLQNADGGMSRFVFQKGSAFKGTMIYISGSDPEGNSSPYSDAFKCEEGMISETDQVLLAISSILNKPQVVWGDDFNDMDQIEQWMIDQERVVEDGSLQLSPSDSDYHLSKINEAVASYAAGSGKPSQAVWLTFSYSGDSTFRMQAFYKDSDSYETFKDDRSLAGEFGITFNKTDATPGDLPYVVVQADGYEIPPVPMQGATAIRPHTRYELLLAIDNRRQELFAAIWEKDRFNSATFARLQNDEKLMELASHGKLWGLGIFQWGGANSLSIDSIHFIAFDGFSLP